MRRTPVPFLLLIAVSFFIGCTAIVQSNRLGTNASDAPEERNGLTYYLPRVKLLIEAEQTEIFVTNYVPAHLGVLTYGVLTNSYFTNLHSDGSAPKISTSSVVEVHTALSNVSVIVTRTNAVVVRVSEILVPDSEYGYVLQLKPKSYAADTYGITVSTSGFLTSINATNSDQTGEIIKTLAETAIEAYKLANGGFDPSTKKFHLFDSKGLRTVPLPDKISVLIDPVVPTQIANANSILGPYATITIAEAVPVGAASTKKYAAPDRTKGAFYRAGLPYTLTISNQWEFRQLSISVPNSAPIVAFNPIREAFAAQTIKLSFDNGFLKEVGLDKPSGLKNAVTVPYTIIKSVATLPTNILQFKLDYSSANTKLIQAQSNELAAWRALSVLQRQTNSNSTNGN